MGSVVGLYDPPQLARLVVRRLPNVRLQFVVIRFDALTQDKLGLTHCLVVDDPKLLCRKGDNNAAALHLSYEGRRSFVMFLHVPGPFRYSCANTPAAIANHRHTANGSRTPSLMAHQVSRRVCQTRARKRAPP